jgi:cytochrome c
LKTTTKLVIGAAGVVLAAGIAFVPFAINRSQVADKSVARGHALAVEYCSRCHAVEPGKKSPVADAPPFYTFAQRWPLDDLEESLAEGIMVGHEKYPMPVFQFDADQIHDFIAYLKTIQEPAPKGAVGSRSQAPASGGD